MFTPLVRDPIAEVADSLRELEKCRADLTSATEAYDAACVRVSAAMAAASAALTKRPQGAPKQRGRPASTITQCVWRIVESTDGDITTAEVAAAVFGKATIANQQAVAPAIRRLVNNKRIKRVGWGVYRRTEVNRG